MEIIRLCPFSVATVVWGEHPTGHRLTISVKGTFVLTHRADASLAPQQDSVHGDISWDHNPQASLFAPSDFVPYKPRIDVIFSGRAFAPGGTPVESLTPKMQVGHLRKSLRVMGPRVWMEGSSGLGPSAPERFTTAPLRYELAAMQGENLSGIQLTGSSGWPLPRIETLDDPAGQQLTPGFGPLPIRWRAERQALNEAGNTFVRRLRSQHAVAPEGFPFSIFNCAPLEQQVDEIEPAPTIILEHLSRKIPRLETRVPTIRPRAFFRPHGSTSTNEVDMRLDTIWIDGVRMVVVLSWRGSVPIPDYETIGLSRIVIAAESPEMTVSQEDVENPPFNYEDLAIKPILPRPFEGEAPDDEGYTLLPTKPARQGATDLPPSPARAPHPRDSSVPVSSGERPIAKVVVGGILPGPNEIVERASLGAFGDEPLPQATQFSSAPASFEPDWRSSAAAASGPPTPRNDGFAKDDAAPATARTGAVTPPTQPPGGPGTVAPGTPKAGTLPPPATLPTHLIVSVRSERKPASVDAAPATERPRPSSTAASDSSSDNQGIVVSSAKPASMKVEPVRPSGDRRSSAGQSMLPMPIADVPIDVCAMVAARIERRPAERQDILQEMGLSLSMYLAAERTWAAAIRAETEQGRSDLRGMYDRCYVAQLELERGPIEAMDYVRLMIGVEHGDFDEVLAEFDVPQSALVRIERVWQERMSQEPSMGARVRQSMASTRRAFAKSQRVPSLSES